MLVSPCRWQANGHAVGIIRRKADGDGRAEAQVDVHDGELRPAGDAHVRGQEWQEGWSNARLVSDAGGQASRQPVRLG